MSALPDIPPPVTREVLPPGRRLGLWIPAVMMGLIVLGLWGPNLLRPPPPAWTLYKNVKGEIRRIVLADKSVMRLNGASQVRVVFEDDDRRLALGQAEAALSITPSARRPFLIAAGDREVRIDGGELNILRQTTAAGARTIATVRRGQARIYAAGQDPQAGVAAGPGMEVSWIDGQPRAVARPVNADNAFAWETHRLAYDKAPLGEVIADLNRSVARPIRLGDPALATLPYSGVLALGGEDVMLKTLAAALPLQQKTVGAEIVLTRRLPCPARGCAKPKRASLQSLLKLKPKAPPHPLPVPAPRAVPPAAKP